MGEILPRAKNAKTAEALNLYRQGHTLKEISEKLEVPESTVRSWKNREKWDDGNATQHTECVANVANVAINAVSVAKTTGRAERNRKRKESAAYSVALDVKQVLENTELTHEQRMFCLYFVRCHNATKAYIKAYGCDEYSAMCNSSRLIRNDKVRDEINRLKQARMTREFLKEEDIFQKYMDMAFVDIGDYMEVTFDKDGLKIIQVKDLEEIDGTLVNIVPTRAGYKVELPDRQKALEWLADHMDLATEEQKARIQALKVRSSTEPAEVEDDGFLEALGTSAAEDWNDYGQEDSSV